PLPLTAAFVAGVVLTAGAWAWRSGRERAAAAPAATAAAGGMVLVASEPPGARVEIDDQAVAGTTPTAIAGLGPGAHVVRVKMPGRAPVEQHTTLAAGQRTLVQVTLPATNRAVRVESVPSGALVYVNGVLQIGQTPLQLVVADNEFYDLRV